MFHILFCGNGVVLHDMMDDCDSAFAWFDTLKQLFPKAVITMYRYDTVVRIY